MIKQLIRMIGAFGDGTEYVDFHKTLEQIENLQKRVSVLAREIEAKIAEFSKLKYESRILALESLAKQNQCNSKTQLIVRWGRRDKQSASIHVECVTQAQTTALANVLRVVVDGEEELLGVQEVQKL